MYPEHDIKVIIGIYIFIKFTYFLFLMQMRLENMKAGRKGNLNVATEVICGYILFISHLTFCAYLIFLCELDISSGTFFAYGRGAKS